MDPKLLIPLPLRIKLGRLKRRLQGIPEPAPAGPFDPRAIYQWAADDTTLSVETAELPHNFTNVLFNDAYFTAIDHLARGNGRHLMREGWINNVIENERLLYVRRDDTGEYFSVAFAPVHAPCARFRVSQGPGYVQIENETHGLQVTWRIHVPPGGDPVELWDVTVRSVRGGAVPVSLFTHVVMPCDGVDLYHGELCRIAEFFPSQQAVFVRQDAERHTQINFPWHNGFMTSDPAPVGWNARPGAFVGPRRSLANPLGVEQGELPGLRVAVQTPHVSLHVRLQVPAGGKARARFIAGACDGRPMIDTLRTRYLGAAGDKLIQAAAAAQEAQFAGLQLRTPEPSINRMLNRWVPTQVRLGATWCKWGWKGYRDTLQHAMAVAALDGDLARRALLDAAAYQHADGFCAHGWNPLDDRKYVDSHAWLVLAATHYLRETADFGLLDEPVRFMEGEVAPLWEHLLRAMRRYLADRGPRGLVLLMAGDWNDSLTGPGRGGRGESVMTSMMACRAADELAALAELRAAAIPGMGSFAAEAAEMRALAISLRGALLAHAWDGAWWLAAIDDNGRPVGSASSKAGQIYLVSQAWAQLGGLCGGTEGAARWSSAWAAVRARLDTGWGLMLSAPPYTQPDPAIGRVSFIRPGHNENASVYTHGTAFAMAALLERGAANEALALWRSILPNHPARPGACQPNVFFNGFYGPGSELQPGLADHAWFTGSAAWMLRNVTEGMLGLQPDYDGLHLRPCLPAGWREATVRRRFRGAEYQITLRNPGGQEAPPIVRLLVDGQKVDASAPLPHRAGGVFRVMLDLG